jgi:hypothetical protein
MRIFLASILNFVLFHCLLCQNIKILPNIFFDSASIGGGTIFPRSPRTRRNEKIFCGRSKKYFLIFSFMNPSYEQILVFSKFDLLTAPGMALFVDLGPKCKI